MKWLFYTIKVCYMKNVCVPYSVLKNNQEQDKIPVHLYVKNLYVYKEPQTRTSINYIYVITKHF